MNIGNNSFKIRIRTTTRRASGSRSRKLIGRAGHYNELISHIDIRDDVLELKRVLSLEFSFVNHRESHRCPAA